MSLPGSWIERSLPLLTRLTVVLACAAVALVSHQPERRIEITAAWLVLVASAASWALARGVPPREVLVLEACAATAVTAVGSPAWWFLPYVSLPLATLGRRGGRRWVGGLWLGVSLAVLLLPTHDVTSAQVRPGLVIILTALAAAAVVGTWSHRSGAAAPVVTEPAYADAHRLLSELNLVARQLSLGLDPHTLATTLVEDLQGIAGGATGTVLVRSAGGRFVPVIGDPPSPLTESVVLDAWVSADAVRRSRSGVTVLAMPLRMGERVVAVAVLTDRTGVRRLSDDTVTACREVIAQAGPRLASALLFDDVRRLATVDERQRLAREIHDGIAQDLASVGYQIDDIAGEAPAEVSARLNGLREHLTQLVSELRLSIFDLRAAVDPSIGLSRTLGDYVQKVGKQSALIVHVSAEESPHRLPVATEVELLRIVQEAVTNVRKHAGASNLWLTVRVNPPEAHIRVMDDGGGLGPRRPDSMGITGMGERAARIGAELSVRDRDDGSGTIVEVALELRRTTTLSNSTITHTDRVSS